MTNPVTAQLARRIKDRRIRRFVERWDALEALIIRIYKSEETAPDDQKAYRPLRRKLRRDLNRYREALDGYWPGMAVGGELTRDDPFAALLAPRRARAFVGNWRAMQQLPAARQAINEWLLDRVESR
jgi:hypothetical protein